MTMQKSYEARRSAKVERFVASLTVESEFFGLLGTGYRDSFYKIYVRATKDTFRWWRFEVEAGPSRIDPLKNQSDLKVAGRAAAIWAPLPFLCDYEHDPAKRSMARLWSRVADLSPLSRGLWTRTHAFLDSERGRRAGCHVEARRSKAWIRPPSSATHVLHLPEILDDN
jgi:hypothetical protein